MLYSTKDIAKELAAQLPDTDLGVTSARLDNVATSAARALNGRLDAGVVVRLDNGQEFLLAVTRWNGPRAAQ